MGIKYDLTNRTFGDFVAKEVAWKDSGHHNVWKLVCPTCGNTIYVRASRLMNGEADVHCDHDSLYIPQSSGEPVITNPFVDPVDEDDYKDTMGYNDDDCCGSSCNLDDALSTGYTIGVYRKQKVEDLKDTFQNGSLDDLMSSLFGPDWEKAVAPKTPKKIYFTPDDMPNNIHVSFDPDADILSYPMYYKVVIGINNLPQKVSGIVPQLEKIIGQPVFDVEDYEFVEAGDYLESEDIPIYGLVIAEGRKQSDMTALWDSLEALLSYTVSQKYNHLAFSKIGCGKFGLEWKDVCSTILELIKVYYGDIKKFPSDKDVYINFTAENPFEDEDLVEDWGL